MVTLIIIQLGAYMVESSLGRRYSLAGSTFVTALFCIAFIYAESSFTVRTSSIGLSLSATVRYFQLHSYYFADSWDATDDVGCTIRLDTGDFRNFGLV